MIILKNLAGKIPDAAVKVLNEAGNIARDNNCRAYLVGGAVRDAILNRPASDLDVTIEVPADSDRKTLARKFRSRLLAKYGNYEFKLFEDFGTMSMLLPKDGRVDFVLARKERYPEPGALPEVENGTLGDDLFRRDFTINAMAMSLNLEDMGLLVDPFGGYGDLKKRRLKILHKKSFIDDPTRILRALRFSARLGFSLEKETEKLLKSAVKQGRLRGVSKDRIKNEFLLALKEKDPGKCLEMFDRFGVSLIDRKNIKLLSSPLLRKHPAPAKLAVLLHSQGPDEAKRWLKGMNISRESTNEVMDALRFVSTGSKHKLPSWSGDFLKAIKFTPKKISITGEDLIKFGLKPGPMFGKILKEVNCSRALKTYSQIKKYLEKYK